MAGDRGVQTHPALVADGWVRRFLADENRAREAVETYTAAGFEVRLEPLTPSDFGTQCQECSAGVCAAYSLVYTRKRAEEEP